MKLTTNAPTYDQDLLIQSGKGTFRDHGLDYRVSQDATSNPRSEHERNNVRLASTIVKTTTDDAGVGAVNDSPHFPFLWARRRQLGDWKDCADNQATVISSSVTNTGRMRSRSLDILSVRDQLTNFNMTDHHLGSIGIKEKAPIRLTTSEESRVASHALRIQRRKPSNLILEDSINTDGNHEVSAATAISFPWKVKTTSTHHSGHRASDPDRLNIGRFDNKDMLYSLESATRRKKCAGSDEEETPEASFVSKTLHMLAPRP